MSEQKLRDLLSRIVIDQSYPMGMGKTDTILMLSKKRWLSQRQYKRA